jgi:hypothetical protein
MAVSQLKEALELDPDYGRAKAQARRSLKTISVGQRTNRTAACGLVGAVGCPQTCLMDLSPIYRACASSFPDLPAEDISRIIKCHGLLQTHQGKLSVLYSLNDSGSHFLVPLTSRVMHHKMTNSHADGIDKILRTAGK